MSDFVQIILSNTLYMIITLCIVIVMVYFAMKKMAKLFIVACIILIAFLSYVYYTDMSVEEAVDKAGEVVK
jgi:hypothetical protein